MDIRLADQRSAVDVEHLINGRTLRLWPGGLGHLRLQSDYSYRRQTPKWVRPAFVWDRTNHRAAAGGRFLAQLAVSEPEKAHTQALSREPEAVHVVEVADYLAKADLPAQEFLAATSLALSRKTTAARLTAIMHEALLPALFDRYPEARLVYLEVDSEASQRLQDIVVLHLYERQNRDEVHRALLGSGFFPQVQGGFSPVSLVTNSFLTLTGFFYPWLYFVPVARPGGVFLLLLNAAEPYNLNLESPSLLETLGFGLGHIHGWTENLLTDLTRFFRNAPRPSEVESLVLGVAERMNHLLVALYDIDAFASLEEQLSTCFTTVRLCEEIATGFLTTNAYLRKITFFNVWDKVTGIQRQAHPDVREVEVKRRLVQPGVFRTRVLTALPDSPPVWSTLKSRVFDDLVSHLESALMAGAAPWTRQKAGRSGSDRFLADLLVSYRNSVHGYGPEHLDDYLSHAGLIPDSILYLAFFWWLALVYRPADYLRGRWVG